MTEPAGNKRNTGKQDNDAHLEEPRDLTRGAARARRAGYVTLHLAVAVAAWVLLVDPSPAYERAVLPFFWALAVFVFATSVIALFSVFISGHQERNPWLKGPPGAGPLHAGHFVHLALWTALIAGGQLLLVSAFVLSLLMGVALHVEAIYCRRDQQGRWIDPLSRSVHRLMRGLIYAVYVCVGTPLALIAHGVERLEMRWTARLLRKSLGNDGEFIYFLYSEAHQRDHFLGEDGLLDGVPVPVVARTWRDDVTPAREAMGWVKFHATAEGRLLHACKITRLRENLPFIAIVPPKGRVQIFKISQPYRARRRDKGAALAEAEAEIRAAIEAAFGKAGEAGWC